MPFDSITTNKHDYCAFKILTPPSNFKQHKTNQSQLLFNQQKPLDVNYFFK